MHINSHHLTYALLILETLQCYAAELHSTSYFLTFSKLLQPMN